MNRKIDRRIHFWGKEGARTGWVTFGEGKGKIFEVGTVSHLNTKDLPYEKGVQTLNLIENPGKKFITPFYYGIVDGDHDLNTTDDRLLYLVLFDQTEPIRLRCGISLRTKRVILTRTVQLGTGNMLFVTPRWANATATGPVWWSSRSRVPNRFGRSIEPGAGIWESNCLIGRIVESLRFLCAKIQNRSVLLQLIISLLRPILCPGLC